MIFSLRINRLIRKMRHQRSVGVSLVMFLLTVSVLGNAICFHIFDGQRQGLGFDDALWYSFISITTIGYGDFYAESGPARLGTLFFVVAMGLATFSVVIGMGIDWVAEQTSRIEGGLGEIQANDHIIIVNFPSESRLRQIVQELMSDSGYKDKEIVIVADSIDRLPFSENNLMFVRGPILEQETYQRACIKNASMAIVLAMSYTDPSSDAIVASVVSVMDSLNSETHIVAECLNPKHRMLFDTVNCDAVIYSMQISGNLLAQEVHDPGVAQLIDTITSNIRGTTLYSVGVEEKLTIGYGEIAKRLFDADVNLLCVNRGLESLTSFTGLSPQPGDRVIYAGTERWTWSQLKHAIKA